MLGTRRLATLQALAERTAGAPSPKEAAERAVAVLAENAVDVPFALLYLVDDDGFRATLTGAAHLTPGSPARTPGRTRGFLLVPASEQFLTGAGGSPQQNSCPGSLLQKDKRDVFIRRLGANLESSAFVDV